MIIIIIYKRTEGVGGINEWKWWERWVRIV